MCRPSPIPVSLEIRFRNVTDVQERLYASYVFFSEFRIFFFGVSNGRRSSRFIIFFRRATRGTRFRVNFFPRCSDFNFPFFLVGKHVQEHQRLFHLFRRQVYHSVRARWHMLQRKMRKCTRDRKYLRGAGSKFGSTERGSVDRTCPLSWVPSSFQPPFSLLPVSFQPPFCLLPVSFQSPFSLLPVSFQPPSGCLPVSF
jgi:hypothetical protein